MFLCFGWIPESRFDHLPSDVDVNQSKEAQLARGEIAREIADKRPKPLKKL